MTFGVMVVRGDVLKALLKDPKWAEKIEKAETYEEMAKIVHEYLTVKGYKLIWKRVRGYGFFDR